ncbi:hypothetical protein Tco_1394548 [Tanacetum coccineum]
MIRVKFNELTSMDFECNNSEPGINYMNFQDSSEDSQLVPLKTDLDNLFGPLYEEYYETSSPKVSDNFVENTLDNDNTSLSSSIVVEEDKAPQIVSSSAEQVATEPNYPVLNENANELVQEVVAYFNGNVFYNAPPTPVFKEAESSSTYQDPSNMHEFHQKHRSSDKWTKNHPIEQVIVSTIELKNIKEAMLDASWIESMQDELNQFKRLDVWELVECPISRNIIIILTGIDNDIYSTVDACPNACEMWKAIKRLKQGESINVQDHETNLYWEFGKFTSQDGESLESYYSRFYKMMNELVRNKCDVTNHQVNVQFLLQLQPKWQRSQQAATRNKGKAIVNSSTPTYDQEPAMKIYKPINNNLRTSSNTSRANQDNTPRINKGTRYDYQRTINVVGARENVGTQVRDDTDDEPEDQELEAHYLYMAHIQEVTPDAADNSRPIFDTEPLQKEHDDINITIDSLDMSTNGETIDQDDDDLAKERVLLDSLIEKLKCEIDDNKNRNKFLESSNKTLIDKLKDLKKFQAELDRYHDMNYASKMEINYAKAKGCYNDNLALMLAPKSDETIRLAHKSRSKLCDLIKPFDYKNLNNLYDLFVPQCEKSPE